MFTTVLSIGRAYRHITQRFRSRIPRRYCHLITLVTSVYRKTNVFLTTVGTATPPGGKMGEWSIGEHSPKFTQQVSLEYQRWLAERFIIA